MSAVRGGRTYHVLDDLLHSYGCQYEEEREEGSETSSRRDARNLLKGIPYIHIGRHRTTVKVLFIAQF